MSVWLQVYWEGEGQDFFGTVTELDREGDAFPFLIQYDDDTEENCAMYDAWLLTEDYDKRTYQFVDEEIILEDDAEPDECVPKPAAPAPSYSTAAPQKPPELPPAAHAAVQNALLKRQGSHAGLGLGIGEPWSSRDSNRPVRSLEDKIPEWGAKPRPACQTERPLRVPQPAAFRQPDLQPSSMSGAGRPAGSQFTAAGDSLLSPPPHKGQEVGNGTSAALPKSEASQAAPAKKRGRPPGSASTAQPGDQSKTGGGLALPQDQAQSGRGHLQNGQVQASSVTQCSHFHNLFLTHFHPS